MRNRRIFRLPGKHFDYYFKLPVSSITIGLARVKRALTQLTMFISNPAPALLVGNYTLNLILCTDQSAVLAVSQIDSAHFVVYPKGLN